MGSLRAWYHARSLHIGVPRRRQRRRPGADEKGTRKSWLTCLLRSLEASPSQTSAPEAARPRHNAAEGKFATDRLRKIHARCPASLSRVNQERMPFFFRQCPQCPPREGTAPPLKKNKGRHAQLLSSLSLTQRPPAVPGFLSAFEAGSGCCMLAVARRRRRAARRRRRRRVRARRRRRVGRRRGRRGLEREAPRLRRPRGAGPRGDRHAGVAAGTG